MECGILLFKTREDIKMKYLYLKKRYRENMNTPNSKKHKKAVNIFKRVSRSIKRAEKRDFLNEEISNLE